MVVVVVVVVVTEELQVFSCHFQSLELGWSEKKRMKMLKLKRCR